MGYISGENSFIESAHRSIDYVRKTFGDNLTSNVSAINLLNNSNIKKEIIIIRCNEDSWSLIKNNKGYYKKYIIHINDSDTDLPDAIKSKKVSSDFSAFICKGMTCSAPIINLEDFIRSLNV
jgi:uncharacterized protein YyaL (SSP411 family)